MNIPWKIKSWLFGVIGKLKAEKFLHYLQKYVTKRSRLKSVSFNKSWEQHKNSLIKYKTTDTIFEFGAGQNLAQNLYLSPIITKQIVVDLNQMIDLSLVNASKIFLKEQYALECNQEILDISDLENYGIFYRAPFDAASTDFPGSSIDACISTDTLEHIPEENVVSILQEVWRILRPGGILSCKIDYSDHYSHTDKSISSLNFLRYSPVEWEKFNHSNHYQSRLRHNDYKKIFMKIGFQVIEDLPYFDQTNIPDKIATKFNNGDCQWLATSGYFVARKEL